jgi:hypothetical protein
MMLRADDATLAVLENRATAGVLLIRKPLLADALYEGALSGCGFEGRELEAV